MTGIATKERNSVQHTLQLPGAKLKDACTGLAKVVHGRVSLPVLGHVRVEADSGLARFQVTDLESTLTWQVPVEAPEGFPPSLLPLDPFRRIVRGAQESLCLVHHPDRIEIRCPIGGSTVSQSLPTLPIEEWPSTPSIGTDSFGVEAGFKHAIIQALECASRDSNRYVLNGVCLDISDPGCHSVVATDGRHLFAANTFRFHLPDSLIVPTRKFLQWSEFAEDGPWQISTITGQPEQPRWIGIQSDHWTFLTKAIDGSYPNWRQVMPARDRTVSRLIFSDKAASLTAEALPRMPGNDDPDQVVRLLIEQGQLILASRPRQSPDWSHVPVPSVTIEGKDLQVSVNRGYLIRALRFGFRTLEIENERSALLFVAPGRQLVVMPVLGDGPAASAGEPKPDPEPTPAPTPVPTTKPMTESTSPSPQQDPPSSSIRSTLDKIETIRTSLRQVMVTLNEAIALLKVVEKEKRSNQKEIETVRATLRSLRSVEI